MLDTMSLSAKDTLPIPPQSTLPTTETSKRSIQLSSLPTEVKSRLSNVDNSRNLAGEASIEPVDVSFVGTSRNDRSFVEDISVIQADPVNEVTILTKTSPMICSLLTETTGTQSRRIILWSMTTRGTTTPLMSLLERNSHNPCLFTEWTLVTGGVRPSN